MVRLDEIFDIWYGVNLEVVNCEVTEKGIPFVSRQSTNNGINCNVKPIENITPNPANTLSIAASGSVLTTFFHEYEYYSGRDVYIAKPKKELSKTAMLYYCYVIEQNKYRYNYGRAANRTLRNILVPTFDKLPNEIKNQETEYELSQQPLSNNKISLDERKWEWFLLSDLFKVSRGTRLTKPDREKGNIPFITAGKENEGVACYISNKEMTRYNNAITIDMFGFSCFRNYEFCCDDNILVLKNEKISQFAKIFISTLINNDSYKCAYGRQYRQKTLAKHQIKLPITKTPTGATCPDWQFMEDYIKSLPYSGCL
ncbi:restriction endonuclease subunit S [Capnocytophaga sp. ARDL2]|uniref:restriction endonuclease subunit S n=1 Tax=Capnocytophaga sp. ARDL2 TaxID=3238809 RepID=UPI00355726DF